MHEPQELRPQDVPDFPPADETGDIDLTLIDYNLSLTPSERVRRAEEFSRLAEVVRQAGIKHYGMDPRPPEITE